jgi:hypothetical protein
MGRFSSKKVQPVTRAKRWSRNRRTKNGGMRSNGERVWGQGAGAVTKKAFGAGKKTSAFKKAMTLGLNARLPYHLGLPRPVGPYQVIRTTKLLSTTAGVCIFSPLLRRNTSTPGLPEWYQACGVHDVNYLAPINGANNTTMIDMPLSALGGAAEVVPAAMTVQVMNARPLIEASGMFTMARVSQQLNLGGDTRTWEAFKTQFDSFFRPRLLSGGKLALRGVSCNALPLDMTEYSTFAPMANAVAAPGIFTWSDVIAPGALSPIVFTHPNPGADSSITFLITIEWRVRFDPASAAAASHVYHPHTSDGLWGDIIKAGSDLGHGIVDIADVVADAGEAVGAM